MKANTILFVSAYESRSNTCTRVDKTVKLGRGKGFEASKEFFFLGGGGEIKKIAGAKKVFFFLNFCLFGNLLILALFYLLKIF